MNPAETPQKSSVLVNATNGIERGWGPELVQNQIEVEPEIDDDDLYGNMPFTD